MLFYTVLNIPSPHPQDGEMTENNKYFWLKVKVWLMHIVAKTMNSGIKSGFKSRSFHLKAMWPQASYLMSLSFLICEMRVYIIWRQYIVERISITCSLFISFDCETPKLFSSAAWAERRIISLPRTRRTQTQEADKNSRTGPWVSCPQHTHSAAGGTALTHKPPGPCNEHCRYSLGIWFSNFF